MNVKPSKLRILPKTIRLSTEEFQKITLKAKNHKMRFSGYVRETALTSDDTRLPRIRVETISQIRKIGTNWNQIAHYLNVIKKVGGFVENDQLVTEFKKIGQQLDQILEILIHYK